MLPPDAPATSEANNLGAERIISLPLREAREVFEREYLNAQMLRFSGNISRTAGFIAWSARPCIASSSRSASPAPGPWKKKSTDGTATPRLRRPHPQSFEAHEGAK